MAAPAPPEPVFDAVVLDRDRLAVTDASVSRAANAPAVQPLNAGRLLISVPPKCARRVWLLSASRFDYLQRLVAPESFFAPDGPAYPVRPTQLSQPGRVARGSRWSLGLMDLSDNDEHVVMVALPRMQVIPAGVRLTVDAPCVLWVGPSAVQFTPERSVAPDTGLVQVEGKRRWELPRRQMELDADSLDGLDDLPPPSSTSSYVVPEAIATNTRTSSRAVESAPMSDSSLNALSQQLLTRFHTRYVFFPLIENDSIPRLAIGYRKPDGSGVHTVVSNRDPAEWLEYVSLHLKAPVGRIEPAQIHVVHETGHEPMSTASGAPNSKMTFPPNRRKGPLATTVNPERHELTFPEHVVEQAKNSWRYAELPAPPQLNPYQTRALQRATLLCLQSTRPRDSWPSDLNTQWSRLFGADWASGEQGRALPELTRELGLDWQDAAERELVKRLVERRR